MPLKHGYSFKTLVSNVKTLQDEGRSKSQAWAISLKQAREDFFKRHPSGFLPSHLREKRKDNPVPLSKHAQIKRGAELYTDFTGHEAEVVAVVEKPKIPDTLVVIGTCDGILYTTVRDGITESYIHEFKAKARPTFVVSPDGKQIFLLGGNFDFTERGIVDRR